MQNQQNQVNHSVMESHNVYSKEKILRSRYQDQSGEGSNQHLLHSISQGCWGHPSGKWSIRPQRDIGWDLNLLYLKLKSIYGLFQLLFGKNRRKKFQDSLLAAGAIQPLILHLVLCII